MKYVGRTHWIHDARGKATGRSLYAGDMRPPRMAYARLLLSPTPHAAVVRIDTKAAEGAPGVLGVYTHHDVPEARYNPARLLPMQEDSVDDEPVLAAEPRYIGDRVAAVVAESPEAARRAVDLIEVEYEPLTTVADLETIDRLRGFHSDVDDRMVDDHFEETRMDYGEEPQADEPATEVSSRVRTPKIHHAAMETHVCLADYDDASGALTIWSPCQGVYGIRTVVADLLNLPYHKVRVIKTVMGGSFGGKQEVLLEPVTAFLALRLKRPVLLQLDRFESIVATMTRPATLSTITSKVGGDGRLASCRIESLLDAGGYIGSSIWYGRSLGEKIGRLYRVGHVVNHARTFLTNTPKAGGARGWGSPEFFAAMEIHMDRVAAETGLDPVELRLKNVVRPGDMDPIRQLSLGNARIAECIQKGAESFGWVRRRRSAKTEGPVRRGIGMAAAAHTNGMAGLFPDFSSMTLKMNEDGSFILNTCLHDMGCGTLRSMQQIVAQVLDVQPDRIEVLEADTGRSPYDFGTYASRVTYVCGAGALRLAQTVKDMLLNLAADRLNQPASRLEARDGRIGLVGQPPEDGLTYAELNRWAITVHHREIIATQTHDAKSNPGAYGAHFVEVEVETDTGMVRIIDYLAVHDVGRAINPGMVEGQIHGAVQMGLGFALTEQIPVDASARVRLEGFKDYHLVNAPDMPVVRVLLLEEGGDDGPFEAKSIGEIALVPVAPAVVNAVNHALGQFLTHLPVTPEKIIAAVGREA